MKPEGGRSNQHQENSGPQPQPQEQGQLRPDVGKDYSAALRSIRADQNVETFVADLHQNKEPLLSLAQQLMRNREDKANPTVGVYLNTVLKMHVFDIDPFSNNPADDYPPEGSNEPLTVAERREAIAFDLIQKVGFAWFDKHPDSEAARAVALHSIYAPPVHHQELLKEMWPFIQHLALDSTHSQKKQ
jgi:hypothetical protein